MPINEILHNTVLLTKASLKNYLNTWFREKKNSIEKSIKRGKHNKGARQKIKLAFLVELSVNLRPLRNGFFFFL